MYPLTAEEALRRVKRRVEDPGNNWYTDAEYLELMDEAAASELFTQARMVDRGHERTRRDIPVSSLTLLDARNHIYQLPETVVAVSKLEGLTGNEHPVEIHPAEMGFRDNVWGPSYVFDDSRPGQLIISGATPFNTLRLWYVRAWAPLHFGTCQAGGAAGVTRFGLNANVTGRVIQRPGLYEGMDVILTNDTPAGSLDARGRITGYAGTATREATMAADWPGGALTAASTYSLVVPLSTDEITRYYIESCAELVFEEMGRMAPMPVLDRLRADYRDAISRRGPTKRVWNFGA